MGRKRFRYLKHMADVEFEAYGDSFEEALENAALALLGIVLDVKKISALGNPSKSLKIVEKADSIENLAWFLLQDIVTKRSSLYLNAFGFQVEHLKESAGEFIIEGRLFYKDTDRDYTLLDVKAVTPSGFKVLMSKSRCTIRVIVDV